MESIQNLILQKYQINDLNEFPGDNLTHKLENVKKLVKEQIRKEKTKRKIILIKNQGFNT